MFPCKVAPSLSYHRGTGKTEDSTRDSPKRKPKKTRQDREKPKLPGQAAANKHLEQMLSDSLQGGAGKGLTTPTKIGVLSAGKPNYLATGDREGAGWIWFEDVRKKHDQRLATAFLTPEISEPELASLDSFRQILTCPFCGEQGIGAHRVPPRRSGEPREATCPCKPCRGQQLYTSLVHTTARMCLCLLPSAQSNQSFVLV